jgi:biotin transport system substrate-specific component
MQTSLTGIQQPARRLPALLADAAAIAGASLLVAISAQVAIPLPFTPVPVTLQTLVVLLCAAGLGSRRGLLAVLAYLAEGAAGLPVFAGGRAGAAHLLGPTGGYLAGFLAAAVVVGALADAGWTRKPLHALAALLAGSAFIYAAGMLWLGAWVGYSRVIALGLLPFLPGEAFKLAVCLAALSTGFPSRGRAATPRGWRRPGAARTPRRPRRPLP